jgi:hypothetical protein
MKNYTYYIYLIPGVKIGCTMDLEKRMNDQGFTEWDILWQQKGNYEFGWVAGDKEKELQELYGLPIDKNHYMIARNARLKGTLKAVETNRERGHMQLISTFESRSRGGKKSGLKPKIHLRKLTYEQAEEIRKEYAIGNISQRELAKKYNSNHTTISKIIKRILYNEA